MADWITTTMESLGYLGIGLLMFLENLFPPIPSELIMPLAGFTVAKGGMNFGLAVLAGVVGTVLGAFPWYYAGQAMSERRLKRLADRYGKWLAISSQDIDLANGWFRRQGYRAVFFCRMVPGVRTLISLPAGMSSMAIVPFIIYSTLGTALWVGFLTYLGYLLGEHYHLVDKYLGPVAKLVILGLFLMFVIWFLQRTKPWKKWRKKR